MTRDVSVAEVLARLRELTTSQTLSQGFESFLQEAKQRMDDPSQQDSSATRTIRLLSSQYDHPILDQLRTIDRFVSYQQAAYAVALAVLVSVTTQVRQRIPRTSSLESSVDEQAQKLTKSVLANRITQAEFDAFASSTLVTVEQVRDVQTIADTLDDRRFAHPRDNTGAFLSEVLEAYENGEHAKVTSLRLAVSNAANSWQVSDFTAFNPEEFEDLIASLSEERFQAVAQPSTIQDVGVDVVTAIESGLAHVQVKHYPGRSIGAPELDKYVAQFAYFDIEKVFVVTSGSFTKPARVRRHLLTNPNQLELIECEQLAVLLTDSSLLRPLAAIRC